jgi:hypothetical protein
MYPLLNIEIEKKIKINPFDHDTSTKKKKQIKK